MRSKRRRQFVTGILVVSLSALVGVTLGQSIVRVAQAQQRVPAQPAIRTAISAQTTTSACPYIEGDTSLSLFAEDYSASEGLSVRHGGKDSAKIQFQVRNLPPKVKVPLTFTFGLSYEQSTQTFPGRSSSIAQAMVSIYLSGAGRNFINAGNTQMSRGGVNRYTGSAIPSGTVEFTAMVANNQTITISALIQASAISSNVSATARSLIALDLISVSFSGQGTMTGVISAGRAVALRSFSICPDQKCYELYNEINDIIRDLKNRYNKLLIDEHNLYCEHYYKILYIDGRRIGSYDGHIEQFEGRQRFLIKKSNEAGGKRCIVPPDALEWAYKEAPQKPSNPPCIYPGGI